MWTKFFFVYESRVAYIEPKYKAAPKLFEILVAAPSASGPAGRLAFVIRMYIYAIWRRRRHLSYHKTNMLSNNHSYRLHMRARLVFPLRERDYFDQPCESHLATDESHVSPESSGWARASWLFGWHELLLYSIYSTWLDYICPCICM